MDADLTVREAAEKALEARGAPGHPRAIARVLDEAGMLARATTPGDDRSRERRSVVLADREAELLELKGPCSDSECRLHYAHRGPHDIRPAPTGSEDVGELIRAGWRARVRGEFGYPLHTMPGNEQLCECPACCATPPAPSPTATERDDERRWDLGNALGWELDESPSWAAIMRGIGDLRAIATPGDDRGRELAEKALTFADGLVEDMAEHECTQVGVKRRQLDELRAALRALAAPAETEAVIEAFARHRHEATGRDIHNGRNIRPDGDARGASPIGLCTWAEAPEDWREGYRELCRHDARLAATSPATGGDRCAKCATTYTCGDEMPVDTDSAVTPACRRELGHGGWHCDHVRVWEAETGTAQSGDALDITPPASDDEDRGECDRCEHLHPQHLPYGAGCVAPGCVCPDYVPWGASS